jgi:flagellar biosynthesis/type III secretory pathway protein FliH
MAIQNERGALSLAHGEGYEAGEEKGLERGREQGREQGLRLGIEALCDALGIDLSAERKRELQDLDAEGLEMLMTKLRAARRWP